MTEQSQNTSRSNAAISTDEIESNIQLFENDGNLFDFWKSEMAPTMDTATATYMRANFPRGNPLRNVILELAFTMPVPKIRVAESFKGADKDKPEPKEPAVGVKGSEGDGEDGSEEGEHPMRVKLQAALDALLDRNTWEGQKDFYAAMPAWRANVFVTGGLFFKLPQLEEAMAKSVGARKGQVWPERMRGQWSKILPHPKLQKVADGYEFTYPVGGAMSDTGQATNWAKETILRDKWTRELPGQEKPEEKINPFPFLPASDFQWEDRDESLRGIPIMQRLKAEVLNVLKTQISVDEGVKRAGSGIQVMKNVKESIGQPVRSGGLIKITDASPTQPADFKIEGNAFDDGPGRRRYEAAMTALYEAAFLTYRTKSSEYAGDPASGEALGQMGKKEHKYKIAFTTAEGRWIADLLSKILTMEGIPCTAKDLIVEYDLATAMTQSERIALASLYFQNGFIEQGLLALGHEEDNVDEIMAMRETRRAGDLMGDKEELTAAAQAELDKLLGRTPPAAAAGAGGG